MRNYEKRLYDSFSIQHREEAIKKFGKTSIKTSESHLLSLPSYDVENLKNDFSKVWIALQKSKQEDPKSKEVQNLIGQHYKIIEGFWGKIPQKEGYKGLGQLFVDDERYTKSDREFGVFLRDAIHYFADTNL